VLVNDLDIIRSEDKLLVIISCWSL
jgi:hypothetical protein